jgi:hypothetical protein
MRQSFENWRKDNGRNSFPPPFEITSPTVEEDVLSIAQLVCERKCMDMDDLIDDPNAFKQLVSDDEWKVLNSNALKNY